MDGNDKKRVGRPKSEDPKIKLDSIRLKTSTIIDLDRIADKLLMSKSLLVQTILENSHHPEARHHQGCGPRQWSVCPQDSDRGTDVHLRVP